MVYLCSPLCASGGHYGLHFYLRCQPLHTSVLLLYVVFARIYQHIHFLVLPEGLFFPLVQSPFHLGHALL